MENSTPAWLDGLVEGGMPTEYTEFVKWYTPIKWAKAANKLGLPSQFPALSKEEATRLASYYTLLKGEL